MTLFQALQCNNFEDVLSLIDNPKIDLNSTDVYGYSALTYICSLTYSSYIEKSKILFYKILDQIYKNLWLC